MTLTLSDIQRMFAGRSVVAVFVIIVGPLVVGTIDTDLMTPLALPGYVALSLGSSIGSYLFPNLALWVFWAPFLFGSYAVSLVVAGMYRFVRKSLVM
jgi:hydrogenase/urease accessory protein HupE